MEHIAVIGANYGDEGKGRLVNYLANDLSTVVRYSGSAQAGHTVVEEGRRHVFKHFGSATLRGVPTILTESFLCHPIMHQMEMIHLRDLSPSIHVDHRSPVILPTDMIINQALERKRGVSKHGSCGMGVRQAIERGTTPLLRVTAGDVGWMARTGKLIRVARRHLELWCGMNGHQIEDILEAAGVRDLDGVLDRFSDDCDRFTADVSLLWEDEEVDLVLVDVLMGLERVIYEGSQGLALDPGCGRLPYLTPSHVGLGGILSFIMHNDIAVERLEVVYTTRPYLTRHGVGPLPREGEWALPVTDETNVPNPWQDSLRFAPLDFKDLVLRVRQDQEWLKMWPLDLDLKVSLAVSCVDHVENTDFPFYDLRGDLGRGLSDFLNECGYALGALSVGGPPGRLITCYGENRDDTHDSGDGGAISQAA